LKKIHQSTRFVVRADKFYNNLKAAVLSIDKNSSNINQKYCQYQVDGLKVICLLKQIDQATRENV
jgi:hypothetical protein